MSQPGGKPAGHEDDWWGQLYDDSTEDTGPAPTPDTLDDRFASAAGTVEGRPGSPGGTEGAIPAPRSGARGVPGDGATAASGGAPREAGSRSGEVGEGTPRRAESGASRAPWEPPPDPPRSPAGFPPDPKPPRFAEREPRSGAVPPTGDRTSTEPPDTAAPASRMPPPASAPPPPLAPPQPTGPPERRNPGPAPADPGGAGSQPAREEAPATGPAATPSPPGPPPRHQPWQSSGAVPAEVSPREDTAAGDAPPQPPPGSQPQYRPWGSSGAGPADVRPAPQPGPGRADAVGSSARGDDEGDDGTDAPSAATRAGVGPPRSDPQAPVAGVGAEPGGEPPMGPCRRTGAPAPQGTDIRTATRLDLPVLSPESVDYVGSGPPTYEAEPTVLPPADPDDLDELVADTVLDGARYGACTLRAASVRGDSARFRGEPRRDALLTARFGTGEHALVLVAMATGARATPGAHRAAAEACQWIGRAVGRSHARLADDMRAGRRGDLKSGLHRLTDRSLGRLRASAAGQGIDPEEYAATLRCLLLPADPECRTRLFFGVGDGGLFRLRDGEWQDIEPRVLDVTGEPAVGFGSLPPETPEGDRLTMDLGIPTPPSPYEPAPQPPREPFRFRASLARPGDTLLMCTGGLAEPLRGEPELGRYLTGRWSESAPPGLAAFLADTQVRVKGYADDRTAAAVWEA
ncbi:protein phosphatase 2C domain-containing protein [Streptomyces sp. NPDC003011]